METDVHLNSFGGTYKDAINVLTSDKLNDKAFNLIILNYVISSLIAADGSCRIDTLFDSIAKLIIRNGIDNCIIIINEVNDIRRGINSFMNLESILQKNNITIFSLEQKYFASRDVTPYGTSYTNSKTVFGHPRWPNNNCTSAQLLINCGV